MISAPARPPRSETLSLTGLRGLAALSVLVAHYSVWCAPYERETVPGWLARGLDYSAWGMSLFFTLSGFVIAYNYMALDWGTRAASSAGRFAWLRFSRLYPVLLVYLALLYMRPSDYGDHALTAQFLLLASVESLYPAKINGHWLSDPLCWSISTEIFLYAMFVGCVVIFRKARQRFGRAAIFALSAPAALYLLAVPWLIWRRDALSAVLQMLPAASDPIPSQEATYWFLYWSPYIRFYDFVFGWAAAVAVLRGVQLPSWLDNGIIPLCCAAVWLGWVSGAIGPSQMISQPLMPPLFAAIMLARPQSRLSQALSVPALLFLGEISYSLYLFHPFATNLFDHARGQPFSWPGFAEFCGIFALDFVIALALAAGLYRVVEMPAQKALRQLCGRVRGSPRLPRAARWSRPDSDGSDRSSRPDNFSCCPAGRAASRPGARTDLPRTAARRR